MTPTSFAAVRQSAGTSAHAWYVWHLQPIPYPTHPLQGIVLWELLTWDLPWGRKPWQVSILQVLPPLPRPAAAGLGVCRPAWLVAGHAHSPRQFPSISAALPGRPL